MFLNRSLKNNLSILIVFQGLCYLTKRMFMMKYLLLLKLYYYEMHLILPVNPLKIKVNSILYKSLELQNDG